MTTVARPTTLESIPSATIQAIRWVGRTVTYRDAQYRVHSVEGYDFYAFESANGGVTVDLSMSPCGIKRNPVAMIIPAGHKIGDGFGREVYTSELRTGVCLTKPGDSVWH